MKKILFLSILFLIIVSFNSCSEEESSEEIGTGSLKITATIGNINTAGSNNEIILNFDSGYVWIAEIVFDGTLERGTSISRTIERFSKIDFETGIAVPSLDDITIPAGVYTFVNLGIELRDEDSQPAILMEGIYTNSNNVKIPIRFEFNSGEVFEAETNQEVTVSANEIVTSKIVFDPLVWFSVVSINQLDNADINDNGVIVISEDSNDTIFDLVADRLDESTQSVFE